MKSQTSKNKKKAAQPAPKPKSNQGNSRKKATKAVKGEAKLSAPWESDHHMQSISFQGDSPEVIDNFVKNRTKLHLSYIEEQEKTKRLSLVLAVFLLALGLLVIVYAPKGREAISYWIGGALLVFSAGAAGYKRVWGRSKIFSIGADQDRQKLDEQLADAFSTKEFEETIRRAQKK